MAICRPELGFCLLRAGHGQKMPRIYFWACGSFNASTLAWRPFPQLEATITVEVSTSHGIAASILGPATGFKAFCKMPPNIFVCSSFLTPP